MSDTQSKSAKTLPTDPEKPTTITIPPELTETLNLIRKHQGAANWLAKGVMSLLVAIGLYVWHWKGGVEDKTDSIQTNVSDIKRTVEMLSTKVDGVDRKVEHTNDRVDGWYDHRAASAGYGDTAYGAAQKHTNLTLNGETTP